MMFYEGMPIMGNLRLRFCKQEKGLSRILFRCDGVSALTSSHAVSSLSLNSVSFDGILSCNRQEARYDPAFSLSKIVAGES